MAIVSMRSRKRLLEVSISGFLCIVAFFMQMQVLNNLDIHGSICNLPLTLTIVWGLVFGSTLPPLTATELRRRSFGEIFSRQLASGSPSGFLIGWFLSWVNYYIFPVVYPLSFPLVGWASGYFCLRSLGQGNLLAIPLTFILTIIAEGLMSWELFAIYVFSHPTVPVAQYIVEYNRLFSHLSGFILPEALLNSVIAPFIYFPMRRWYELVEGQQSSFPID